MKKLFSIFFVSLLTLLATLSLFFVPNTSFASECAVQHPDTTSTTTPPAMHAGYPAVANSLVPCGQYPDCQCQFADFFTLVLNVYSFAITTIAFPVAALMVVIAGLYYIFSAGNPALAGTGKNILIYTAIGLALVLGSWLMIDVILKAIGYVLPWNNWVYF